MAYLQGDVHKRHGRWWDRTRLPQAVVEERRKPSHVRKMFEEQHHRELRGKGLKPTFLLTCKQA